MTRRSHRGQGRGTIAAAVASFAAAALVAGPLAAQEANLGIRGYLEHQAWVSELPSGWTLVDYDRLRVDLDGRAGRGAGASAGLVWQLFRGTTTTHLSDLLPAAIRDELPADATFTIGDRHFLNHAFVTLDVGPVAVTAGKQYLAWGRGLVFNPTELFRPKALFDPSYEREGVGAVAVAFETGALSDAAAVYVPGDAWDTGAAVARVRGHLAGFDVSALAARLHERDTWHALLGLPIAGARRVTVGGDVSGEFPGLGLWAEGTWSARGGEGWAELTTGANTTLPGDVLVNVEAFYDGRGRRTPYELEDWLALAAGDRRTLGRVMLFGSASGTARDLLTWSLGALANAGDWSAALLPGMTWSFAENVDLVGQLVLPVGPDGTEFGTRRPAGLVRGRVYF